jgi:hypothetical protein
VPMSVAADCCVAHRALRDDVDVIGQQDQPHVAPRAGEGRSPLPNHGPRDFHVICKRSHAPVTAAAPAPVGDPRRAPPWQQARTSDAIFLVVFMLEGDCRMTCTNRLVQALRTSALPAPQFAMLRAS